MRTQSTIVFLAFFMSVSGPLSSPRRSGPLLARWQYHCVPSVHSTLPPRFATVVILPVRGYAAMAVEFFLPKACFEPEQTAQARILESSCGGQFLSVLGGRNLASTGLSMG
jgi:hypothetical protein